MSGDDYELSVEQEMAGWYFERGVTCVVAPCCGLTFDAAHTDVSTGGYSCPSCPTQSAPSEPQRWGR